MPRTPLPLLVVALSSVIAHAGEVRVNRHTFVVPDGFTVELAARAPLVDRPITIDFDEAGHLYVADSSGSSDKPDKQLKDRPHRILRLTDTDGDGKFDTSTVFADKMMFPEGTMWLDGSLYVAAPPSIWKLTDTDGDGVADQRVEWFDGKTLTGCANDLHGPYAGPDGWIYWCKGAFAKQTYTLPNGNGFTTRAAHIFRARPDGSQIEPVMTGGMDNPVDVTFTPGGERIFTTTFLQNPAAGKRDGLIHAIYGGLYGKVHDVIDGHPRTGPDLMPVLSHLGPAAPCGLTRYESTAFGQAYTDNLFSCSFNLHKVFRHILIPSGSTFTSRDEPFVTCDDVDFHPTDIIEDADGSLLIVDTGGWYKLCCPTSQLGKPDVLGAIYRVRRTDAPKIEDPRGLKLAWDKLTPTDLATFLNDPRTAVQKRAIAALAATPSPTRATPASPAQQPSPRAGEGGGEGQRRQAETLHALTTLLASDTTPRTQLNAIWALCRIDNPAARIPLRNLTTATDANVRQAAIHTIALWRDRAAIDKLEEALTHADPATRRSAAEALGRIGDPHAVPAIVTALGNPSDRALEHALIYALIEIDNAKSLAPYVIDKNPAVRRATMIALDQIDGGNLQPATVAAELSYPDAPLREAAAWLVTRHADWGDTLAKTLHERLAKSKLADTERADLQRQLTSLAAGSPAIQTLLAQVATNAAAGPEQRQLALAAMSQTTFKDVPQPWLDALTTLLANPDPAIASSATATLRKLNPKNATSLVPELLKAAARADLAAAARLDALAVLPPQSNKSAQPLPPAAVDFVLACLAPQNLAPQRLAAAEVLARSKLDRDQLARIPDVVKTAGPLELDRLLTAFDQPSADDSIATQLLTALDQSKSITALRPDTLRARLKRFGPDVQAKAAPLLAKLAPDAAVQKKHLDDLAANLAAGDVRRGQLVFNSAKAACASCHAIGYLGGHVGPDLTRIGSIRQERDLLESIVYPSASFVQSFEPMIVITSDGDTLSGLLRKNDADEIVLLTGPDQEKRIPKKDVEDMRPGTLSIMPPGLDQQLTPEELADLVAFLRACK